MKVVGCGYYQLVNVLHGVCNVDKLRPSTSSGEALDANGCSAAQLDDDGHGVSNGERCRTPRSLLSWSYLARAGPTPPVDARPTPELHIKNCLYPVQISKDGDEERVCP